MTIEQQLEQLKKENAALKEAVKPKWLNGEVQVSFNPSGTINISNVRGPRGIQLYGAGYRKLAGAFTSGKIQDAIEEHLDAGGKFPEDRKEALALGFDCPEYKRKQA